MVTHAPRAPLAVLAASALLAAACGSSGSGSGSAPDAPAATGTADAGGTAHVVMKVLEFSPITVKVKVGQRVMWTNEDSSPHNVTYVSGPPFRSSRTLAPGAQFAVTLTTPGTIHYYCSLHPWMKATIIVSS